MNTIYEWDYETVDENGDVQEHNHADKLADFSEANKTDTLVLVRNVGDENRGLQSRTWAYVVDGKLPEFFKNAAGNEDTRVPKRFHTELAKHLA